MREPSSELDKLNSLLSSCMSTMTTTRRCHSFLFFFSSIFVGTWNVGGRAAHGGLDLSDWLADDGLGGGSSSPHIYVLGYVLPPLPIDYWTWLVNSLLACFIMHVANTGSRRSCR